MKRELKADKSLVACCGLYCGACKFYLKGWCAGCLENTKAQWCKVRSCCIENRFDSCASCTKFPEPNDCKKFNNFMSKAMGFVFNSDRHACICKIKEVGADKFAEEMVKLGRQSYKRAGHAKIK